MQPPPVSIDLETVLARFEEAWRKGSPPAIEGFLPPNASRQLLEELIKIDLNYRWSRPLPLPGGSRPPRLEDYAGKLTQLGPLDQLSLDLISGEYWVRHHCGDRPAQQEYVGRFPRHGPKLLERLRRVDAELAEERATGPARPTAPVAQLLPPLDLVPTQLSVATAIELFHRYPLLTPAQLDEISQQQGRFTEPRALARELIQRGWVTPYQVNLLMQGRSQELLIGPYLVLERLGAGGAGQVFKARHQLMQRIVALKVIRKELLGDPEAVSRFHREIQVISQLTHPHVVQAHDAGVAGQTYFLAMEYVEGTDLARLVKQSGPLPIGQACGYIRQAALGLQHIHDRGLVHRDIKPSNLMLTLASRIEDRESRIENRNSYVPVGPSIFDPRSSILKILDLGLARMQKPLESGAAGTLTATDAVMMGTIDFMAPEQAINSHQVDIRADIYSLGCTFYYLLTGRPPFADGTMAQKLLRHQQVEPAPIEQARRDVPAPLAALLRRMMAKLPGDRFQTPAEVVQALAAGPAPRGALVPVSGRPALPVAVPLQARGEVVVIDVQAAPRSPREGLNAILRGTRVVLAPVLAELRRHPRLLAAAGLVFVLLLGYQWITSGHRSMYLADMREEKLYVPPGSEFFKNGHYKDIKGEWYPVSLNNIPQAKALQLTPPRGGSAKVTYRLEGEYRYFKATVGLAGPSNTDNTYFTVMADGQQRWQSKPVRSQNDNQICDISITGVDVLELWITWGTPNHESFPAWGNPMVSKDPIRESVGKK